MSPSSWIVCQLGAREHYAIPSALYSRGLLQSLYTDAWLAPGKPLSGLTGALFPRLKERYENALDGAHVVDFTSSLIAFELREKLAGRDGWERILARNAWFQDRAVVSLRQALAAFPKDQKPVVFCYSYAARRILEYAKSQGCKTILGQIDPGPVEEDMVASAVAQHPELTPQFARVPSRYWDDWREECRLADSIVVNSAWSKRALVQAGISADKLAVVPLMYDAPLSGISAARTYPGKFDEDRPLKVLFLGSLIIRKGIAEVFEAARRLADAPVEFWFVGSEGLELPEDLRHSKRIHWVGAVRRGETRRYYDGSDVFLFPSLSDGFGLTQLEAMSSGLPVIASNRCGEVVQDGENGRVLPEVDAEHIAAALQACLANPDRLAHWSANAVVRAQMFGASRIMPQFLEALTRHDHAS